MNVLCFPPGCRLLEVFRHDPTTIGIMVIPARWACARGSSCGRVSRSGHGCFWRRADDRPCSGERVRLAVRVRRFLCRNPSCPRRTFAQRLPDLIAPRARRPRRPARAQAAAPVALGGEAAARLLGRLGMATRADTLLGLVRALPRPTGDAPRVLGVDDWAMEGRGQLTERSWWTWSAAAWWIGWPSAPPRRLRSGCGNASGWRSSPATALPNGPGERAGGHPPPCKWPTAGTCPTTPRRCGSAG